MHFSQPIHIDDVMGGFRQSDEYYMDNGNVHTIVFYFSWLCLLGSGKMHPFNTYDTCATGGLLLLLLRVPHDALFACYSFSCFQLVVNKGGVVGRG